MGAVGYVYVLKNEHIKPIKIGYTDRTPQERAEELSNFTGVPGKWRVCKSWKLADAFNWEQRIFRELAKYRTDGEFFQLSPEKAIELITLYLLNLNAINSDGFSSQEICEIRIRNNELDIRTKRLNAEQQWKNVKVEFSNKAQAEAEKIYGKTIAQTYRDEENNRTSLDTAKAFVGILTVPVWAPLMMAYKALFTDGEDIYKETDPYSAMRNKIEEKQRELLDEYKKSFMRERGVN